MLFRSLFTGVPADLNAYRARLQAAMRLYAALATLGAFTLLFGALGVPALLPEGGNVEYFSGFYCGMGTGLALGFLVLILRTRRLLRNEAALRRDFTKYTDERNRAIRHRALLAAGVTLFFLLYIAMLVGSLFAPALTGTGTSAYPDPDPPPHRSLAGRTDPAPTTQTTDAGR